MDTPFEGENGVFVVNLDPESKTIISIGGSDTILVTDSKKETSLSLFNFHHLRLSFSLSRNLTHLKKRVLKSFKIQTLFETVRQ